MNFTAIIAVLERKGIITRSEGEALVEFLNNKPQSTMLADAVEQISEFIKEAPKIVAQATKAAKTEATKIANEAVDTAKEVAETVAKEAAQIDEAVQGKTDTASKSADTTAKK
jgi:vacuolar-type H+-ATPase subunit H